MLQSLDAVKNGFFSVQTASSDGSSEIVCPTLPPDVIFNILSRLPVRALGKFKSVSKMWLSIIDDPYFMRMHRNRSLKNPNLLLLRKTSSCDGTGKTQMRETWVQMRAMGFDGTCNFEFKIEVNEAIALLPSKWGLICFVGESGFYACNPSTQEFVKLPEATCCTSGEVDAGMGYISSRNEYVLIHLFDRSLDIDSDYDIGCEILRLSDGYATNCSWKVVDANCPYVVRGWGVLVDNVFYWMIWDAYDQPGKEAILSFDLEKEEFGTVLPPDGCFDPNGVWSLVELGGLLCLIDTTSGPFTLDIWVLKDCVNHEWVKEHSIDLNGFDMELLKFVIPLDQRDGQILSDETQKSLDCYVLENRSFRRMSSLVAGEWTWLRLYTESFFALGT